jgi:hypothetical protein
MALYTTVLWIEMGSHENSGNEPSIAIRSDKLLSSLATTSFSRKLLHFGVGTCSCI